jgi:EAL domain-containing protein (putative c-di-GMP-specific phosphodiesterase class I)
VLPGEFIGVLEELGLIDVVGEWALREALCDQRRWREAGLSPPPVAVNVSLLQMRKPNFGDLIAEIVSANPDGALELEITESMIMENVNQNIVTLRQIRDAGVTIAIDDFGTGYCSLSYVAKLPVTTLKIDRSFIVGMAEGPEGLAIVSSIIALAHALRLVVVAEGVETAEQARLLHLLACDQAQGFLYSRPVSAVDLMGLLRGGPLLPLATGPVIPRPGKRQYSTVSETTPE